MNYIAQIKGFWLLHQQYSFNTTDIALYFYLLEICNSALWVNPFKRNTAKIIADLKISRSSLERSRKQLKKYGIITFKSINGTANTSYTLADLEPFFRNKFTSTDQGAEQGTDQAIDQGTDQLNKNSKLKQVVVTCTSAFNFFVETRNNRILKDRFNLDNAAIQDYFKVFYDSKVDLGDLNNKTIEDAARYFYYWLPKHLAASEKEKSCAKKENSRSPLPPLRGVAVAMKFADVKMREL